jgi:epsilon-lactone hydrolase
MKRLILLACAACICLAASLGDAWASDTNDAGRASIPDTISPAAQAVLGQLFAARQTSMVVPGLGDYAAWKALHGQMDQLRATQGNKTVEASGASIAGHVIGGVPVLDVRPKDWADDGKLLIYIHGGAFTLLSAKSTADNATLMASASGLRVISINYTNPPALQWVGIQEQIPSVFRQLLAEGYSMDRIAIYGDSAGGNLVVRTVLNLRDSGLGIPRAVVLFSPWADLTNSGDTASTLKDVDPTLSYENLLASSARAYAGELNLKDPRVSPLYADFTKGFPPTLIQEGTRTIFLSTIVRLYRALKDAGIDASIDMYEGMWHVFQVAPIPEAQRALSAAGAFLKAHLD